MKVLAQIGALAVLCALAPAQEPAGGLARSVTAQPDRRVELDFEHYYTNDELKLALASLASAYPEFLRLETLGRSRGGRELWIATASAQGGDPARKPGVLAVGNLGRDDLHGAELALFTLLELVQNHARDATAAAVLASSTLYVVPCLDPDLRARVLEGEAPPPVPRVQLDRNFPTGWDPWSARAGAGPYPLSEPESAALATFLLDHPNVAVVQTYLGRSVRREGQRPDLTPADAALYARATARGEDAFDGRLVGFPGLPDAGGSLLAFAHGRLGALALAVDSASSERTAEGLPAVVELFQLGRRAARASARIAGALPRLELGEAHVQRLRGDLWQIDVALRNTGLLPTCTGAGLAIAACPPPVLTVEGARLVAAALPAAADPQMRIPPPPLAELRLPQLEGGGNAQLRLIVQGEPEAVAVLRASAPRAGIAEARVPLR